MAVQAAVSAGPIRRFWLATRWFASKLVALTIASESDSGKSSEELQAWIKRLNPEDGSTGDVRIVGEIAVDRARQRYPALAPAITKVLESFDQALTNSTHWDEVLTACEELHDAIDRFAPPETGTIFQHADQLEKLADEFETKWKRLSEDARTEEARGVRCRRPKVGASECDCVKCRRGSLRNAFYCDCGKELLAAIDAGALLDDDSFLTAISAGFDFPPNTDQRPLHAWLRATQHWLPQRHPDWGDSWEQYPGRRQDADLTGDERDGKAEWMPMRAVADLLQEEDGVLSQESKDSLETSRIMDEWLAKEESLHEEAKTDPGRLRQLAVEKGLCPEEATQSEASAAVKGWLWQQCGLTLYETDAVPIDCMIAMVDEIAKPDWSNEAPWFTLRVMAGHERHSGPWGWDWEFLDKWQRDPRYERSVMTLRYRLRDAAVQRGWCNASESFKTVANVVIDQLASLGAGHAEDVAAWSVGKALDWLAEHPKGETPPQTRNRSGRKKTDRADDDVAHSSDFRSVLWFGRRFTFTATQAACVRIMWQNWEQGTPVLSEVTILVSSG